MSIENLSTSGQGGVASPVNRMTPTSNRSPSRLSGSPGVSTLPVRARSLLGVAQKKTGHQGSCRLAIGRGHEENSHLKGKSRQDAAYSRTQVNRLMMILWGWLERFLEREKVELMGPRARPLLIQLPVRFRYFIDCQNAIFAVALVEFGEAGSQSLPVMQFRGCA
jgi:hypothetical protein